MNDFIKEIPSDSTVVKIDIQGQIATIHFAFDVEMDGKIDATLSFEDFAAINVWPRWQKEIEISGIQTKDTSTFLEQTKTLLTKDEVSSDIISSLKSYQIMDSVSENP